MVGGPPAGVARDPGGHMLRWERGAGAVAPARPRLPLWPAPMNDPPQLSAQDLIDPNRGHYEKLCSEVAPAVNAAPAGQVINASEEKVRDLLADFRLATYQAAVQLRTDAAQAAFPPSAAPADGKAPPEQGAG